MDWISVKDILPRLDYEVLYTNGRDVYLGRLLDMGKEIYWSHYDFLEDKDITHWMPLPELPNEDQ